MKRILQGILNILKGRKEIIIGKEEILEILPHRERMLLLDRVTIGDNKVSGEFEVTEAVCEGHALMGGKPLFRGSDFFDMAAQLLGVWAAQHQEFAGRIGLVRKYGGARFRKPVIPHDYLVMEINASNIEAVSFDREEGRQVVFVRGEKFIASVGNEQKAEIFSVELVVL